MDPLLPKKLMEGDIIGIVAPSGPIDAAILKKGSNILEEIGFSVKTHKHILNRISYLAGSDDERKNDLEAMFLDKDVKAILCARGGYGAIRTMSNLDIRIVKDNPKIFIGYSDATVFLNYFTKRTGLITFHGPMLQQIGENDVMTLRVFKDLLTGELQRYKYRTPQLKIVKRGIAEGALAGGCLSVLLSVLGTKYEPEWEGKILFLEDVDEPLYKIDRMLTQLRLSSRLEKVMGLIVGKINRIKDKELISLINEILSGLDIPAVYNFPAGHILPNLTLPIGAQVILNAEEPSVTLETHWVR
ncbi:MAG TPA: LD-carboxypeptidase [bacterium]